MSLSIKTIRRRIADGTIPAYQCGRRPVRIRLDDLEAALRPLPSSRSARSVSRRPAAAGSEIDGIRRGSSR